MRIASAFLMVSLLLIGCSSSSAGNGESTNEGRTGSAHLRDLEKQWISALIRVDRPVINRLRGSEFASEVAGGHSSDPVPPWLLGSAALPGRGTWIETNLIVDDVTVRSAADAAVVTSTQTYHPPSSGQTSLERAQRSYEVEDHWQKRAGRWQVVRRVVRPI